MLHGRIRKQTPLHWGMDHVAHISLLLKYKYLINYLNFPGPVNVKPISMHLNPITFLGSIYSENETYK